MSLAFAPVSFTHFVWRVKTCICREPDAIPVSQYLGIGKPHNQQSLSAPRFMLSRSPVGCGAAAPTFSLDAFA
jgi:hypothetical protein